MITLDNGGLKVPIQLLGEEKVFFSAITKLAMFGLGIVLKENFLAYSTQFVIWIIRLVPGNMVIGVDIWSYVKT